MTEFRTGNPSRVTARRLPSCRVIRPAPSRVLARLSSDLNDAFRLRAELELKLREMDAADAVLIRNAFAELIRHRLTQAVWRPLLEISRLRQVGFRRRLEHRGEVAVAGVPVAAGV